MPMNHPAHSTQVTPSRPSLDASIVLLALLSAAFTTTMSSVSQSTTSTTSNSLDSLTDFGSAQASAYAQALLTGTNVNPAAFKDASFSLLSIVEIRAY